jgi:endonuclease-3
MPREPKADLAHRIRSVLSLLEQTYPDAHCELNYSTPLELLVATILSAQCTDKRVNQVTANLFAHYRTAADYAAAPLGTLEREIQSTGFFRNKARNLRACCQALVERHGGNVPASMDALVALDGVGRKTANVVLGNAFHQNCGVVVDTHVGRLAFRLGFTKHRAPEKVEADLMRLVPQDRWTLFSHWLIWHGRRRCGARNPDCARCELRALCPRLGVRTKAPPAASERKSETA